MEDPCPQKLDWCNEAQRSPRQSVNMHTVQALAVRNIGKIYQLYARPVDRLKQIVTRRLYHKRFVALEDISFALSAGETLGIIGDNGAGKSTLLKILSGTLTPTTGEVITCGRVAALLELGAGFHPEFTGRQNIYLNAALMGLKDEETRAREQEIIDFSELEDSIDRPVKTYSSGMYVRLAFSIATTVDPDILIIDEALSVGDQHFQKKCIDRMMSFRRNGKTILFCSHSMYLVQELCDKAIWLKRGRLNKLGQTSKVINAYTDWVRAQEASLQVSEERNTEIAKGRDQPAWIRAVEITDGEGRPVELLRTGDDLWLRVRIGTADNVSLHGHIGLGINRNDDEPVFGTTSRLDGLSFLSLSDHLTVALRFPALKLLSGQYYITVALADEHALHLYDTVRSPMFHLENASGELGLVSLDHQWEIMD
jgi:lipopolysaccharide transport system ATP-binding protein